MLVVNLGFYQSSSQSPRVLLCGYSLVSSYSPCFVLSLFAPFILRFFLLCCVLVNKSHVCGELLHGLSLFSACTMHHHNKKYGGELELKFKTILRFKSAYNGKVSISLSQLLSKNFLGRFIQFSCVKISFDKHHKIPHCRWLPVSMLNTD